MCSCAGKQALFDAIRALKEEGSTNLTAGIGCGMRIFEEELPANANPNPNPNPNQELPTNPHPNPSPSPSPNPNPNPSPNPHPNQELPAPVAANPSGYSLLLAVATDGRLVRVRVRVNLP